ncbi:calcium-binding protein [Nostoc sp. UHCC 0870]|uniref:calcium-binding protein n=1 Tax=Nostoc sp. UHCC 0870 TaxID=2914041 RepID=UPI001EDE7D23|nr:calcium-binding protein [Nostoc sp. UHCC 0870]UKO99264.1 calcium-binding protein [Nostoc sp. UHCC 0870]
MATSLQLLTNKNLETLSDGLVSGKVNAADLVKSLSKSNVVKEIRSANPPAEVIATTSGEASKLVAKFAPVEFKNFLSVANQLSPSTDVLLTSSKRVAATPIFPIFPKPIHVILGTPDDDVLIGKDTHDYIFGFAGDDILLGEGGKDFLFGGTGDDILIGGEGNDVLFGEDGDDILINDVGSDILIGGAGNDYFFVLDPNGSSVLNGGSGFDTADYTFVDQAITLKATGIVTKGVGFGTDQLVQVENIIATSSLNDWIDASDATSPTSVTVDLSANSLIVNNVPGLGTANFTVNEFENVRGTAQNDKITGNSANNIINAGAGDDILVGSKGNDILNGEAGNDTADYSNLGQTIVLGPTGTVTKAGGFFGTDQLNSIETITASNLLGDTIDASTATGMTSITANLAINNLIVNNVPGLGTLNLTVNNFENVTGTAQDDIIIGNASNNTLIGGAGNDFLSGGAGNDNLIGGIGVDVLVGGAGSDRFTFLNPSEGVDIIVDFVSNFDKIAVSAAGFGGGLAQGALLGTQFVLGAAATNANHRFIYSNAIGALFFDIDGNGAAAQQQIASISSFPALTSNDILVTA